MSKNEAIGGELKMDKTYMKGFAPYALAAFMVGIVGGFTTGLGPAFVKAMGIAYNNSAWTSLATAVSTSACAPVLGKLGDAFGRRKTLLWGIGVFLLGNVLTACANSLPFMLVARLIVGVGSAAISPVVMAYIVTEFPRDTMARGFSLYMLISSAAVVFGPTVGTWLTQTRGWRAMMWVCVLISALVLVLCLLSREKTAQRRKSMEKFDWTGAGFVLAFFSLLLCVPSFGQNFGWSSWQFLIVLAAAVVAFGGLVAAEKRAERPILPGGFIKRRVFVLSIAALFLTQGLMQANMTNVIVYMNYTQPDNTLVSGYAISIMYLGMSLGSVIIGPLADKYEPKYVLTCSFGATALGCGLMLLFTAQVPFLLLALSLGILGFGLGGNASVFMKVVLSGLEPEQAGAGTGTYGLFRDLAAPFGVAVLVPMFTNRVDMLINAGTEASRAAEACIRLLARVELVCVAVGAVAVLMLPRLLGPVNKAET